MNTSIDNNGIGTPFSTRVKVFLKWSKQVVEFDFAIPIPTPSSTDGTKSNMDSTKVTGRSLKDVVHSLTNVPVDRQKLVAKSKSKSSMKWWKGILKDDFDFSSVIPEGNDPAWMNTEPIELRATLMGSDEILVPRDDRNQTIFLEDMTYEEKKAEERRELMASMENVVAMIPVLQLKPMDRQPTANGSRRDDENGDNDTKIPISDLEENRAYDRLVHGFSQLRIDDLLHDQQTPQNRERRQGDPRILPSSRGLLGRVAMTMGLELQRAYVNDLAVLNEDGTLVSVLDQGHVQMWKHCHRVKDLVHQSASTFGGLNIFPGVDSVLALDNDRGTSPVSFATAGRGCIWVWNREGEPLWGRPSPLPYASPTGLVRIPMSSTTDIAGDNNILCLAARFRVSRPPSRRPRLVPQDNAGRRQVAGIEASEAAMNDKLTKLSMSVQILFADIAGASARNVNSNANTVNNSGNISPTLRSMFLKSPKPVTALASWENGNTQFLAVGDQLGGIMFWKISLAASSSHGSNAPRLKATKLRYLRIASLDDISESRSAIFCLKYVKETKELFVSTMEIPAVPFTSSPFEDASLFDVPTIRFPIKPAQAVHCISVDAILNKSNNDPLVFTLDGHKDAVHSILHLPNGDIVTSGGKMDATTQVWSRSQLRRAAARTWASENGTIYTDQVGARHSMPPPVLTVASTTNICKDAGYVFAAEILKDFKGRDDSSDSKPQGGNPFAVAFARYNVVKIVI